MYHTTNLFSWICPVEISWVIEPAREVVEHLAHHAKKPGYLVDGHYSSGTLDNIPVAGTAAERRGWTMFWAYMSLFNAFSISITSVQEFMTCKHSCQEMGPFTYGVHVNKHHLHEDRSCAHHWTIQIKSIRFFWRTFFTISLETCRIVLWVYRKSGCR